MRAGRSALWGAAVAAAGTLYVLEAMDVFPRWFLVGPVVLGIAGVALVVDTLAFSLRIKGGLVIPMIMIGLSAGTVLQDAELLVDEYSIWPPVLGALGIALLLGAFRGRGGSAGGL